MKADKYELLDGTKQVVVASDDTLPAMDGSLLDLSQNSVIVDLSNRVGNVTDSPDSNGSAHARINFISQYGTYPVASVSNIRSVTQDQVNRIKWRDPDDLVVDDVTLSTWSKTLLVRKLGDYPADPNDGELLLTSTVRNAYDATEFADELPSDEIYYYQLFPTAVNGMVNLNEANRFESNSMTWATVADLVRSGRARQFFALGDVLTVEHAAYGTIYWQIAAFDYLARHSMTLLSVRALANLQFDAPEKTYGLTTDTVFHPNNLLNAGYYHILRDKATTGYDRVWVATIGIRVILYSQLNGRWEYWNCESSDHTATTMRAYETTGAGDPYSVGAVWSIAGVAFVATNTYHTCDGINYTPAEVVFGDPIPPDTYYEANPGALRGNSGNNSWRDSGLRQWLNANTSAGNWWLPQNIWDNPPAYAATSPGFLAGFADPEFLAALGTVSNVALRNRSCDCGGFDVTADKMFLPSRTEVLGTDDGVSEGEPLPLYAAASPADTIKYDDTGLARTWWLRSNLPTQAHAQRYVDVQGIAAYSAGRAWQLLARHQTGNGTRAHQLCRLVETCATFCHWRAGHHCHWCGRGGILGRIQGHNKIGGMYAFTRTQIHRHQKSGRQ